MNRFDRLALLLCLLVPGIAAAAPPDPSGERPARLLVKLRPGVTAQSLESAVARSTGGRGKVGWTSRSTGWREVVLEKGEDPVTALARLKADPAVEAAEPERFARITAMPDDLDSEQWWIENSGQIVEGMTGTYDADIDAPEAWDLTRGSRTIPVAVLDTGVKTDHPDLEANLLPGRDILNGDGDPWDDAGVGHGTPVAGVIGAVGDNGAGMAGLNWSASLLPVKVCDAQGICPYAAIVQGVEFAVSQGARVINLSMTCDENQDPRTGACIASRPGACYSAALADAIAAAAHSGVLVVAAAGNCGADLGGPARAYPCAFDLPNLLCIGATDSRDEMAPFSNHGGSAVRLAAPGAAVLSLTASVTDRYFWDGTSFAAPMAAGAAALVLSRNDTFTPSALTARLLSGADALPSLDGRIPSGLRLNALGAVKDLFLEPLTASGSTGGDVNLVADFDGDGLADALESGRGGVRVALSDGSVLGGFRSWSSSRLTSGSLAADFDGDGRADLLRPVAGSLEVMRSLGDRFEAPRSWTPLAGQMVLGASDVNGDGRADLIRYRARRGFLVSLSNGQGFAAPALWSGMRPGHRVLFADVDGDGRSDMVRERSGNLLVSISQGNRFGPPALWGRAGPRSEVQPIAADVDGDGRADVALLSGGCWNVRLARGGEFTSARPWACDPASSSATLARFDSDGRADLVRVSPSQGWQFLRSTE